MSEVSPVTIAGPLFLTLLFNSGAIGVLTVQVYLYYIAFPEDALHLKLTVWSVYVLELVQTVMLCITLYREFVFEFLDIRSLDRIGNSWFSVPIVGGIVTFIVQVFYVHRITVLGKLWGKTTMFVIGFIVVIISFVQMGAGIALGVEMLQAGFYSELPPHKLQKSAGVVYGTGAFCDIIIAVCMTTILLRSSNGIMPRTRKIIRRLVTLTIEAGTLTAATGVLTIILVMAPSFETAYYQTTAAILSKLYSNTLMVVLNNRMELSNREILGARNACLSALRFTSGGPMAQHRGELEEDSQRCARYAW